MSEYCPFSFLIRLLLEAIALDERRIAQLLQYGEFPRPVMAVPQFSHANRKVFDPPVFAPWCLEWQRVHSVRPLKHHTEGLGNHATTLDMVRLEFASGAALLASVIIALKTVLAPATIFVGRAPGIVCFLALGGIATLFATVFLTKLTCGCNKLTFTVLASKARRLAITLARKLLPQDGEQVSCPVWLR